jgi:hypothetical protein
MKLNLRQLSLCLLVTILAACSGGNDSIAPRNDTLSIELIDRPIDGIDALFVTITEIWIKPQGAGEAFQLPMTSSPLQVNLLELNDENAAVLVDNAVVPADFYNWIEMTIDDENMNSYAMTDAGGMVSVRVPSDRVRLVSGVDVETDFGPVRLIFDWDVRSGLTDNGQDFLLRPAFRMLDAEEAGAISGSIAATTITSETSCTKDDPNVDVGNVVYIFSGADVVPDEIDGNEPNPVAMADAELNVVTGDYDYMVGLMPGSYTVAFTCEGGNDTDDTNGDITFLPTTNVVVTTAVENTDVNF